MAKRLFKQKGVSYIEVNVDKESGMREKMMRETQRRTVPQIFIGERHVGGFDDLYALKINQELDILLEPS